MTQENIQTKNSQFGLVSLIIPVYNEEKCIEATIRQVKEMMSKSRYDYEIIVVNDGSSDQSRNILEQINGIRLYHHETNIGYGRALKSGMKKAFGKYIVMTDADGTYPIDKIPQLVEELKDHDMVVGARAKNSVNIAAVRKPMKWIIGKLANFLSETDIPDLNSGLRAFNKDVAMKFYQMYPKGFSFTTTITLAMHCNGYDVKYIPIEYGKRIGKSKIHPIKDTINFIQLIYRTIMYFNPLKIFVPISIIVFISFIVLLGYDIFVENNLTDKTIIALEIFIQIVVIGLIGDLISKRLRT